MEQARTLRMTQPALCRHWATAVVETWADLSTDDQERVFERARGLVIMANATKCCAPASREISS